MVKYIATYLKTDKTRMGRIDSRVRILGWAGESHGEITISQPHRIPSRWMKGYSDNLGPYRNAVKDEVGSPEQMIRVEKAYSSRNAEIYHIVLPFLNKEVQKQYISRDFLVSSPYNSFQRQAERELDFPFFTIEDGVPGERASIEELVRKPGLALDFETHNWETIRLRDELDSLTDQELYERLGEADFIDWMDREDYIRVIEERENKKREERITTASIITFGYDHVVTTLDPGTDSLTVDSPLDGTPYEINVVKVEDQEELISSMNDIINEFNPFFVYGHNQMTFDYRKAQELAQGLRIGLFGKGSERRAGIAGNYIEQRITPGRVDIDPALYSQKSMWNYNNKLDTVFLHVTGARTQKTLKHEEITEMTDRAEKGDKGAAQVLLKYAVEDSMKSYIIGEALKHEHILLAYLYSSLPARVDSTGNKTLCEEYWVNQRYKRVKTYPSPIKDEKLNVTPKLAEMKMKKTNFDNFSSMDFFYKTLKHHTELKLRAHNGTYHASLFAPTPYLKAFEEITGQSLNRRYMGAVIDEIERTKDKKKKVRLSRFIESILEYPLFRALSCQDEADERKYASFFERGFSKRTAQEDKTRVWNNIRNIADVLKDDKIINHNNNFIILEHNAFLPEKLNSLEEACLGVYLGDGICASGRKGRFSISTGYERIMQGIADPCSNRGERCSLETELYSKAFISDGGVHDFLELCDSRIKSFYEGEEITFSRTAKRNSYDYSINATQKYIDKMREKGVREGDEFSYTYSHDELREKFFGKGGTIRELLRFMFPVMKHSRKGIALEKLMAGEASEEDKELLLFS
ncbi:MAG: hypothetical protein ACLFP2_02630 [Candidatus Woesearchaeota archaeon]